MPRELTIKERMLLCGGNAACETAVVEEFRADEARMQSGREAAIQMMGIDSMERERQADRRHGSFRIQMENINARARQRHDVDLYLHR